MKTQLSPLRLTTDRTSTSSDGEAMPSRTRPRPPVLGGRARSSIESMTLKSTKVPIDIRLLLIKAMMPLQQSSPSPEGIRQAQALTEEAHDLAVRYGNGLLIARCCFYVAYAHSLEAHTSTEHRQKATEYYRRAAKSAEYSSVETELAKENLARIKAAGPLGQTDSRPSSSGSNWAATFAQATGMPLWGTTASPSTCSLSSSALDGVSRPGTSDSMGSDIIRATFGSLRPQTKPLPKTAELAAPEGSAAYNSSAASDTPESGTTAGSSFGSSPRGLCQAEKPSASYLAMLAGLQQQEDLQQKPSAIASALGIFSSPQVAQVLPDSRESSPNKAAFAADGGSTDEDDAPTETNHSHRRGLSDLYKTGKPRSDVARMEEGKSPTHATFAREDVS